MKCPICFEAADWIGGGPSGKYWQCKECSQRFVAEGNPYIKQERGDI